MILRNNASTDFLKRFSCLMVHSSNANPKDNTSSSGDHRSNTNASMYAHERAVEWMSMDQSFGILLLHYCMRYALWHLLLRFGICFWALASVFALLHLLLHLV